MKDNIQEGKCGPYCASDGSAHGYDCHKETICPNGFHYNGSSACNCDKKVEPPVQESWETEFDRKFPYSWIEWKETEYVNKMTELKAFLRETINKAKEEGRDVAVDYIEQHFMRERPADTATEDYEELEEVMEQARNLPTKLT